MKTYTIEGQFDTKDAVEIRAVESIPQPAIEKSETYKVGAIKARIAQIDQDITRLNSEKQDWQDILDSNQQKINEAVRK